MSKHNKKSGLLQRNFSDLHLDDWNSRFWIEKIPENYSKVKSSGKRKESCELPLLKPVKLVKTISSPGFQEEFRNTELLPLRQQASDPFSLKKNKNFNQKRNFSDIGFISLDKKLPVKLELKQSKSKTAKINSDLKRVLKNVEKTKKPQKNTKFSNLQTRISSLSKFSAGFHIELENFDEKFSSVEEFSNTSEESSFKDENLTEMLNFLLFEEVISKFCLNVSQESIDEAIVAYLILSSSKILYSLVNELLEQVVPSLSKTWFDECKEQQSTDLRDELSNEFKDLEIIRIIQNMTIDIISKQITENFLELVQLKPLILESIEESQVETFLNIEKCSEFLVESFIDEDWLEILVEDVINSLKIEESWKLFPVKLQREVAKKQYSVILDRIAEEVYFDILNCEVAELWLSCICFYFVNFKDLEETTEILMPIPNYVIERKSGF
jgi:hypothetical protein